MTDRRLVAAAAISLVFHAVLLTVVGLVLSEVEDRPDYPATLVRLTAASESAPETVELLSPTSKFESPREEILETAEPVASVAPVKATDPVLDPPQPAIETSAASNNTDSRAASFGAPGEVASSAAPSIEDSKPTLITTIDPEYPIQARRLGVEGVVDLVVTVDSTGLPIECAVVPPRVHKVLERSALAAVMQARFMPGIENGQPIQDTYRLKVRFELEA